MLSWRLMEERNGDIFCTALKADNKADAIIEAARIFDRLAKYDARHTTRAWLELNDFDEDEIGDPLDEADIIGKDAKVVLDGTVITMAAAAALMDDEIREDLHSDADGWSEQYFLDRYCDRHFCKYDEDFTV